MGSILIVAMVVIFIPYMIYGIKANILENKYETDTTKFIKLNFDFEFDFKCEYCNSTIKSTDESCPNCGGAFGKNIEYLEKRYLKNQEYFEILKEQEKQLDTIHDKISAYDKAVNKAIIPTDQFEMYLESIDENFKPTDKFTFNCEFCHSTLFGNSKDNGVCTSCGASYSNNKELLILEKIEDEERISHEKYIELQKIKDDMNKNAQEKADKKGLTQEKVSVNFFKFMLIFAGISIAIMIIFALFFIIFTIYNKSQILIVPFLLFFIVYIYMIYKSIKNRK